MRFGIIVTDDDPLWGGEKGCAAYLLQRFEERNTSRDHFEIIYAISGQLPKEEDIITYDGFIISGSHFSVTDDYPWIHKLEHFIRVVYQNALEFGRPRMVGICFGHQLIAKAMGGKVERNPNEVFNFGSCEVEVAAEFLNKEFTRKHFNGRRKSSITLMKLHGEQVVRKPNTASIIGSSQQCKHEILMYSDHFLTTQGHPEYTEEIMQKTAFPIVKHIGKVDHMTMVENARKIVGHDADNCTAMVLSFLRHELNEPLDGLGPLNKTSAKTKRGRLQRMATFQ